MESKKVSEAPQTQAQDSSENVQQPLTAEKTDCVDDKNDKAPSRGMQSCSLGLDVSVSRRIFQTSRSRQSVGSLGLVSD